MKNLQFLLAFVVFTSLSALGQFDNSPVFNAKHPFRIQVYSGGPSLLKTAFKISENFQDEVTYSGRMLIGIEVDYKITDWFSVGLDGSYRYGQINFDVTDSTFFNEIRDKWDVDVSQIVNPFGEYEMRVPRFRGMAKVNFHVLPAESQSDLYFSAGIGYNRFKPRLYKDGSELKFFKRFSSLSWPVSYRTSVGYTYHPIENVGLFAEAGLGGPIISGGVSVRF